MIVPTLSSDIPLVNLSRQVSHLRSQFEAAFETLLKQTDFVGGKAVDEFEESFARYCKTRFCIGVGNGTDALYLIFRALGLKPGDEVITTPMSFIATAEVFYNMGVKVVFVDIDPQTYTLCPKAVLTAITPKTRVLLPVHLYGQPADMASLSQIANNHNLFLVEDAAQAHGAECNGQRAGSFGIAAAFSFYPGKNLGAFGDGGAVTTNDEALACKIRTLANHGRKTRYEHGIEGVNSRLDTLQAAILSIKLQHLDAWNDRRRKLANLYHTLLTGTNTLVLPHVAKERSSVFHLYVIQTTLRDHLLRALQNKGIMAGIHYPIPLHLQPAFQHLGYRTGDFPISEQLANNCLSLPLCPELTDDEARRVAHVVREYLESATC
jgi:dTDP-4-amino-4,6-dideoxygalactose transaminase